VQINTCNVIVVVFLIFYFTENEKMMDIKSENIFFENKVMQTLVQIDKKVTT
jgi:hypothetical protein